MNDPSKKIRRRDCVKLSNKIIDRCRLPIPRVTSIDGIRSNLFTSLLQVLYHRLPEGIIEDPASTEDEVANVQAIVNHLALDLIHIDLSHISGADVIAGEPRAIYNLLEIFCGLHKYLSSTSIGKWNLEESLTETDSQLSSQPSSEESASDRGLEEGSQDGGTAEDAPGGHQPRAGQQQPSPSVSRQSPAAVRGSTSGPQPAPRLSSAGPGLVRTASAGSAGRAAPGAAPSTAAAARVRSTPSGVGQVPSGASAGKVASAAGSAGRVPSASGSAARAASSGPAGRVPSGSGPAVRASAVRVSLSGSAGRVPSSGSAVRVPSSGSAVRVPSGLPATKVPSSVSGVGRVRSGGAVSRQTSGSGPLPASSASAGGEAEASLLPSSESGPAPAARRSVSSGGGSGGAGAAGSSGAGAEAAPSSRVGGKASRQAVQDTARSEAAESETSGDGPSPLRAPSGPGGEFAGLGRSSASRPSHGGLPADGGSSLQLTGSIDHHHYHHYDGEESGESSQPTEHTEDTEEEQSYSSDEEEEEAEEGEPDSEDQTADSPEEASPESELDPQQPWDHSEERQHYQQDTEDSAEEEEEDGQGVDISRQISEEMELMRRSSSTVASVSALRASPEQKRSVSAVKREPTDPKQVVAGQNSMGRTAGAGGGHGERPGRRQLSAPSRPECLQRRRRCDDHSSTSEPGLGRRPGARLPTTNVETVAEIRETGVERDVTETTREQAGDRLHKETVRREVRRKVSSAPHPRHMSCSRQTTRRSVRSDGVGDWLESRVDDSRLRVDGGEADVFEYLRREFPYVHVSAETKRRLLSQYRNQMKYIMSLVEPVESRTIKIRRQEVLKRQALLTDIMRQQKAHDERFRHISDSKRREARIRNMPRDAKISCLRAQRYVSSFQQQFQSRSALNQSKEELLLRAVFEEMLEIQRSRLRSVRKLERQAIDQFYDANGYTSELNRLHQYYEANFRDLAELLSKEHNDLLMAEKQQTRLNDRIRREFRDYMEADVRSLNDKIVNSWQPQFRELDADRVRSDLYRANWKFCVQ